MHHVLTVCVHVVILSSVMKEMPRYRSESSSTKKLKVIFTPFVFFHNQHKQAQ